MLFRGTDTLQIEWASCLGFVAKVLNASETRYTWTSSKEIEEQGGLELENL